MATRDRSNDKIRWQVLKLMSKEYPEHYKKYLKEERSKFTFPILRNDPKRSEYFRLHARCRYRAMARVATENYDRYHALKTQIRKELFG